MANTNEMRITLWYHPPLNLDENSYNAISILGKDNYLTDQISEQDILLRP